MGKTFKVKEIVPGTCEGPPLVIDQYISFLGEVDPEKGVLKSNKGEISLKGKVLVFRGTRGSTVGPYIIYGLRLSGNNPVCMIVKEIEPILIAGCVLANIPLYIVEEYDHFVGEACKSRFLTVRNGVVTLSV
ncbi:MAG: DUF126 domain-containing protein [Desulfurococcaceae archaeon]